TLFRSVLQFTDFHSVESIYPTFGATSSALAEVAISRPARKAPAPRPSLLLIILRCRATGKRFGKVDLNPQSNWKECRTSRFACSGLQAKGPSLRSLAESNPRRCLLPRRSKLDWAVVCAISSAPDSRRCAPARYKNASCPETRKDARRPSERLPASRLLHLRDSA